MEWLSLFFVLQMPLTDYCSKGSSSNPQPAPPSHLLPMQHVGGGISLRLEPTTMRKQSVCSFLPLWRKSWRCQTCTVGPFCFPICRHKCRIDDMIQDCCNRCCDVNVMSIWVFKDRALACCGSSRSTCSFSFLWFFISVCHRALLWRWKPLASQYSRFDLCTPSTQEQAVFCLSSHWEAADQALLE